MRDAATFDVSLFFAALDQRRDERGLSWAAVAREMWDLSAALNAARGGRPIAASTITNMATRGDTTCQHAVFFLRWLDRAPEDFVVGPVAGTAGVPLPTTDRSHRLRWSIEETYRALNEARQGRGATWVETGRLIGCAPNRLTGLRTARYGMSMTLAMRICQWLGRPAADFVHPATW